MTNGIGAEVLHGVLGWGAGWWCMVCWPLIHCHRSVVQFDWNKDCDCTTEDYSCKSINCREFAWHDACYLPLLILPVSGPLALPAQVIHLFGKSFININPNRRIRLYIYSVGVWKFDRNTDDNHFLRVYINLVDFFSFLSLPLSLTWKCLALESCNMQAFKPNTQPEQKPKSKHVSFSSL